MNSAPFLSVRRLQRTLRYCSAQLGTSLPRLGGFLCDVLQKVTRVCVALALRVLR